MEYGCIGRKLTHSFSKMIHNKLCDYRYDLKELEPEDLAEFLTRREFRAVNVTIPYKQAVIPYIDIMDDTAQNIGAVNTIVNKDGLLYGYNTDFSGMRALASHSGIDMTGKKVVILGSGGTSHTARAVAESLGAREILRVSRGNSGDITYDELYATHSDAQILINTTPCGMYPELDSKAADILKLPHLSGVLDAVYNPLRTQLVLDASERGIKAAGGLYMLVSQAVFAAEKFTGRSFSQSETDRIFSEIVREKENIVLTGRPDLDILSIGRHLAELTGRELTDTDQFIRKSEKPDKSASSAQIGNALLMDTETKVIRELAPVSGRIIITGYKALQQHDNVRAFRQNGRIVFIKNPFDLLADAEEYHYSGHNEQDGIKNGNRSSSFRSFFDLEIAGDKDPKTVAESISKEIFV